MGEGSDRGSGRVRSDFLSASAGRVGSGRVGSGRVGSKKSDPWTILLCIMVERENGKSHSGL